MSAFSPAAAASAASQELDRTLISNEITSFHLQCFLLLIGMGCSLREELGSLLSHESFLLS